MKLIDNNNIYARLAIAISIATPVIFLGSELTGAAQAQTANQQLLGQNFNRPEVGQMLNGVLNQTSAEQFFEEGRYLCEREIKLLQERKSSSPESILQVSEKLLRQRDISTEQLPQVLPRDTKSNRDS
ncbi:MAG: hypothetical protein WA919_08955 [Coleofasciculaceae cyanobacterium]